MSPTTAVAAKKRRRKPGLPASYPSLVARFTTLASLTVAITLLLGIGPLLQERAFALLNSDAPNVYATLNNEHVALSLSLYDWIRSEINPIFFVIALATTICSIQYSNPRTLLLAAAAVALFLLVVYDLASEIAAGTIALETIFSDVSADLAGSLLVGAALVLLLRLAGGLGELVVSPYTKDLLFAAGVVLPAMATVILAYYANQLLYTTVPVQLNLYVDTPFSGFYVPSPPSKTSDGDAIPSFKFLARNIGDGTSLATAPADAIGLNWQALDSADGFEVTVTLFASCVPGTGSASKLPPTDPMVLGGVHRLLAHYDKEGSYFATVPQADTNASIHMDFSDPEMFWVDRDEEADSTKITEFVAGDQTVYYLQDSGDIQFELSAVLAYSHEGVIKPANRSLALEIDGRHLTVEAVRPDGGNDQTAPNCHAMATSSAFSSGKMLVASNDTFVNAVVTVHKPTAFDHPYGEPEQSATLSNTNGWLSVSHLKNYILQQSGDGGVDFISLSGNIVNLSIDGTEMHTLAIDNYTAYGSFLAGFEADGKLRLSGKATALWKDTSRLNPTRWERLTWDFRSVLFLAVSAISSVVVGTLIATLRKDEPFSRLT